MSKENWNDFKAWALGITCTALLAIAGFYFRADRQHTENDNTELKNQLTELKKTLTDYMKLTNETNDALLKILNSHDQRITKNEVQIDYSVKDIDKLEQTDKEHNEDITFILKNFSINGPNKTLR